MTIYRCSDPREKSVRAHHASLPQVLNAVLTRDHCSASDFVTAVPTADNCAPPIQMARSASMWLGAATATVTVGICLAFLLQPSTTPAPLRAEQVQCKLPAKNEAIRRFSEILQFRTISSLQADNHVQDASEFSRLHEFLETSFPTAYARLSVEKASACALQPYFVQPAYELLTISLTSAWSHPFIWVCLAY